MGSLAWGPRPYGGSRDRRASNLSVALRIRRGHRSAAKFHWPDAGRVRARDRDQHSNPTQPGSGPKETGRTRDRAPPNRCAASADHPGKSGVRGSTAPGQNGRIRPTPRLESRRGSLEGAALRGSSPPCSSSIRRAGAAQEDSASFARPFRTSCPYVTMPLISPASMTGAIETPNRSNSRAQ